MESPLRFIAPLDVTERHFAWLQSTGEVQKPLSACTEKLRTLVAVLVGTGIRIYVAFHLTSADIDLTHCLIHVHRGSSGDPKSGRLRRVPLP